MLEKSLLSVRTKVEEISIYRAHFLFITLIILVALIIGNVSGFFLGKEMVDEDGFGLLGRHFADYNNFNGTIKRGPIYPFFLGTIIKLFGYSKIAIVFFQSVLLGLIGVTCYFISFKIYKETFIALVISLVSVCYPLNFLYASKLLVELPFALFVLLMLWTAYLTIKKATFKNILLFGVTVGVSALTKTVTLLFPLFFTVFIFLFKVAKIKIFHEIKYITLVKVWLVSSFFMLLTIMPWTIRNYINKQEFVLLTKGVGYEFSRGTYLADENAQINLKQTNDEIWQKWYVEEYKPILKEYHITNKDEEAIVLDKMMKDFIVEHPDRFIVRFMKQSLMFWYRGGSLKKSIMFLLLSLSVIVLFIIGFIKMNRYSLFSWVVLIGVLYFNFLYASIIAIARYSMPLYTPMIIIGAYGMVYTIRKKKENSIAR